MDITVVSNYSDIEMNLTGLTWNITNFTTSMMTIQLTFDSPLYVSEIDVNNTIGRSIYNPFIEQMLHQAQIC